MDTNPSPLRPDYGWWTSLGRAVLPAQSRHRRLARSTMAAVAWLGAGAVLAANLEVTTLSDGGPGSLREALSLAESNGEADVVSFSVSGTIPLGATLPTITTDLEIAGPGQALLTLSGGGLVRVLRIAGGTVSIHDLTITGGSARGGDGADATVGLRGGGGGGALGAGGGIFASGAALTIERVSFVGNRARGGDGGDGGPGAPMAGSGSGGAGGTSSLGALGGVGAGTTGNGGGGGGAAGGFADGGAGSEGNAGGGGGIGGFRMLIDGVSDVGNGAGGSGSGCGGGSPSFQISGDFAGSAGHGVTNCSGSGGGGAGGAGLGGALYLRSGTLALADVTLTANEARRGLGGAGGNGGGDGQGKGGALFVDSAATVSAISGLVATSNIADDDLGTCFDNDDVFSRGTYPLEAPTDLALTPPSVAEGQPIGSLVGTLSTVDATTGDAHTYSLVPGVGSSSNSLFAIAGDELRTAAILDHETLSNASIRVRTVDGCGNVFEKALAVTVANVPEAPTGLVLLPSSIAEEHPVGTVVGSLSTLDPDLGETFGYALVAGAGATDNALFAISGATLGTQAVLDHEQQATRSVRIRTTDRSGLFLEQSFTIAVADVNEAPTVTPAAFGVAEDASPGTVVGTVGAVDPDVGPPPSFSIGGGDPAGAFAIDPLSGVITVAGPLDRETTASYDLTVQASDAGDPPLVGEGVVTVAITDVNEPPTIAPASLSVPEDAGPGTAVGAALASDPDAGTVLAYSIEAGDPAGAFAIDGSSGSITVVGALDHESAPSYALTVRATDDGDPPLFDEALVTIAVGDVNEPPSVVAAGFAVAETSTGGTLVGTVAASDPDAGTVLTFSIEAGDASGAFAIGSSSGQITVAGPLDHETSPGYALTVRATDTGDPALFGEATITITVDDANETPTALGDLAASGEDTALDVPAPGVLANDDDPDGDPLVVVAHDAQSTQGATVVVEVDGSYHYDPRGSAPLQALGDGDSVADSFAYTVRDSGGLEATATVEVTVTGVGSGLVLTKEIVGGAGPFTVGDHLVYRLGVSNLGPGVEAAVVVHDPLPIEVDFVASDCATLVGASFEWTVGDLAASANESCDLEVAVAALGTVSNTARADSLDLAGATIEATVVFQGQGVIEIPVLDWRGLVALAAALALAGARAARRRSSQALRD